MSAPSLTKRLRIIGLVACIAIGAVLPVYVRCILESRAALMAARADAERGDLREAIAEYRHAIDWRAPFNYYASAAIDELKVVSESAHDSAVKSEAIEQLSRALMATRFPFESRSEIRQIERLGTDRVAIRIEGTPQYARMFVVHVGFWLWLVSAFALIWFGFRRDGSRQPGGFRRYALLAFAGWVIWAAAL